jgi:hypothetical protein
MNTRTPLSEQRLRVFWFGLKKAWSEEVTLAFDIVETVVRAVDYGRFYFYNPIATEVRFAGLGATAVIFYDICRRKLPAPSRCQLGQAEAAE